MCHFMSHKHYYEFNVFNVYMVLSLSLSLSLQKHRKTGISSHSFEAKSQKSQVLRAIGASVSNRLILLDKSNFVINP